MVFDELDEMSQKKLLLSIFYATRSELSQHSLSPNFWRVKDVDRKEQEMRSEKWKRTERS